MEEMRSRYTELLEQSIDSRKKANVTLPPSRPRSGSKPRTRKQVTFEKYDFENLSQAQELRERRWQQLSGFVQHRIRFGSPGSSVLGDSNRTTPRPGQEGSSRQLPPEVDLFDMTWSKDYEENIHPNLPSVGQQLDKFQEGLVGLGAKRGGSESKGEEGNIQNIDIGNIQNIDIGNTENLDIGNIQNIENSIHNNTTPEPESPRKNENSLLELTKENLVQLETSSHPSSPSKGSKSEELLITHSSEVLEQSRHSPSKESPNSNSNASLKRDPLNQSDLVVTAAEEELKCRAQNRYKDNESQPNPMNNSGGSNLSNPFENNMLNVSIPTPPDWSLDAHPHLLSKSPPSDTLDRDTGDIGNNMGENMGKNIENMANMGGNIENMENMGKNIENMANMENMENIENMENMGGNIEGIPDRDKESFLKDQEDVKGDPKDDLREQEDERIKEQHELEHELEHEQELELERKKLQELELEQELRRIKTEEEEKRKKIWELALKKIERIQELSIRREYLKRLYKYYEYKHNKDLEKQRAYIHYKYNLILKALFQWKIFTQKRRNKRLKKQKKALRNRKAQLFRKEFDLIRLKFIFHKFRQICRAHEKWVQKVMYTFSLQKVADSFNSWKLYLLYIQIKSRRKERLANIAINALRENVVIAEAKTKRAYLHWYFSVTYQVLNIFKIYTPRCIHKRRRLGRIKKYADNKLILGVLRQWKKIAAIWKEERLDKILNLKRHDKEYVTLMIREKQKITKEKRDDKYFMTTQNAISINIQLGAE